MKSNMRFACQAMVRKMHRTLLGNLEATGVRRVVWTVGVAAVLLAGADVRAQDAPQEAQVTWTMRERARIGVMLEETCELTAIEEERCDAAPVVSSVVVDGPADRAGVRAGDVMVSVDGVDVTTREGRDALLNLKSGVGVRLVVERDGKRSAVDVVPELRPSRTWVEVRTRFLPGPEAEGSEATHDVHVVRVPSVQGRLDEVEVRLDSLRRMGTGFVVFSGDSTGVLRVEVGGPGGGPLGEGHEVLRYVWENQELARRLAQVRDSSLRTARVHLDSLVRLRSRVTLTPDSGQAARFHVRTAPGETWASDVLLRPLAGELRALLLTDLRVAGAEFRQLEGDLAEYFEGADDGLLVMRVLGDTPAARLGLREGDVVIEVDGEKCRDVSTLRRAISEAGPRGSLTLTWVRKGERRTGRMDMN